MFTPCCCVQARNRLIAVKAAQAGAAIRKKEGELSGSDEEAEDRSVRGERRALQVSASEGHRRGAQADHLLLVLPAGVHGVLSRADQSLHSSQRGCRRCWAGFQCISLLT